MLLPLLGACALVGPFQGSEWEPVRGLLSQHDSCRDPRCYGKLVLLCLFLIWQVQHFWLQFHQRCTKQKKVIKVPWQEWVEPSTRRSPVLRAASDIISRPRKVSRPKHGHGQQRTWKHRWEPQKGLQESWAQRLLSWQHRCQGPPWSAHTHLEPILGPTTFSNTCLLPWNGAWDSSQVPWHLRDGHTTLTGQPLSLGLEMHQRREQLSVPSPEELERPEPPISMRPHPTPMSLASSFSNLPSAQMLQVWSREVLPVPSNQQLGMPTWDCPQESWAPEGENQTPDGGEESGKNWASRWGIQRENREDAGDAQASGQQLFIVFGMEDGTEAEILGWGDQRPVTGETDGEITEAGWENQDQMGSEDRGKIQELGERYQRKPGGGSAPGSQAYGAESQEQLRYRTDAQTQTTERREQGDHGEKDADEMQGFQRTNQSEPREQDDGARKAQGSGKQDLAGGGHREKTQMPSWGEQDQYGGDHEAGIPAEERANKDQVGGGEALCFQSSERKPVGQVKEEGSVEAWVLEEENQEWIGNENATDCWTGCWTPGWKKQDGAGSEKASGEEEIKLGLQSPGSLGRHSLAKGDDARKTQMSCKKKLKEIREEDWLKIQWLEWERERVVACDIDKELERSCLDYQGQVGEDQRAESWTSETRRRREKGGEDGTETWALGRENRSQSRAEANIETHSSEKKIQEKLQKEDGAAMQAPEKSLLRGLRKEEDKETARLEEENQGQLRSEICKTIARAMCKNRGHIRGKDDANLQVSEGKNWVKLTTEADGETHLAGWKKEEQIESVKNTEFQAPEKRKDRVAGGTDSAETWAAGEEKQSQLTSGREACLSGWMNQEQGVGENSTEIRTLKEGGGKEGDVTQEPERENQGQPDDEIDRDRDSLWKMNQEQAGGENGAECQASKKRNQREVVHDNSAKIWGLGGELQGLLRSTVNGKTNSLKWKNQEEMGDKNDAEIKMQGKRNVKGNECDDGAGIHASGIDYQEELGGESGTEIQTQGQGNQNKAGDAEAVKIQNAESQGKYGAEDTGGPQISRPRKGKQLVGEDFEKVGLPFDCAGGDGPMSFQHSLAWPPAFTGSGYGAMEQGQAVSTNSSASVPSPEVKHLAQLGEDSLLASEAEAHLDSWSRAPASECRAEAWGPPRESQEAQQKDKDQVPGKAPCLTQGQPWNSQSVTALDLTSASPSLQGDSVPQAAPALVGTPVALPVLPKCSTLRKSKKLLLEALMRRKIAHLTWGLPQRILQSYLLLNLPGPCPLSTAGVGPLSLHTDDGFQGQQKRLCETKQKPPPKPPRVRPPGGKSALEKSGPYLPEPPSRPNHAQTPRRSRPPGGARDTPGAMQTEASVKPKPETESGSWSWGEREKASEPSSERSCGEDKAVPETSERASSIRVCPSGSRPIQGHWRKKRLSTKFLQPSGWRRRNLQPVPGRAAGQQPFSGSADLSNFKQSLRSTAARLSKALLNKMPWSPQPLHSVPYVSLQDPDSSPLLPKAENPHPRENSTEASLSLERNLQPPSHYCAGTPLPGDKSPQDQGAPGNQHKASRSSHKFVFVKNFRSVLSQLDFRKSSVVPASLGHAEKAGEWPAHSQSL